jgi:predicted MFS family arabinose efflux permease
VLAAVVAPFAFAYFLSYLFRVVNAVAGPAIMADVGIDAAALGFLTSVYFLTFAAVQLPLGVALDRYGPRLVESILLIVAAIGGVIFATSDSLAGLAIGRGFIGVGVAAGLMAAFKAYAMAVPTPRVPLVNGIHLAAGGLGALAGGAPAEFLLDGLGWRGLFLCLAGLAVLSAAFIALAGPAHERSKVAGTGDVEHQLVEQFRALGRIMRDPIFLRIAALTVPSEAAFLSLHGLWAGPWLRDIGGYSPDQAALVLSAMAVGLIVGFLGFGAWSVRAAARGVNPFKFAIAGMAAFVVVQVAIVVLPPSTGAVPWWLFACLGTTGLLPFPALTALYPRAFAGRVNTALNFLVFVVAFAVQWLVGVSINVFGPSLGVKGAFDVALITLIVLQIIGLAVLLPRIPAAAKH